MMGHGMSIQHRKKIGGGESLSTYFAIHHNESDHVCWRAIFTERVPCDVMWQMMMRGRVGKYIREIEDVVR